MKNMVSYYRIIALIIHVYFAKWILDIWGLKIKTFFFLTKINFFMNIFYFTYSLYTNINEERRRIHYKNLYSVFKFSFCLAIVVIILYWGILLTSPTLMGNTPTPLILDFFLHGGNLIVLILDFYLDPFKIDKNCTHINKTFLLKFTFFYILLLYILYYSIEVEIYPLISKLNLIQIGLLGVCGSGLFLLGQYIFDLVH
jgi:hypothetical protein